MHQHTKTPIRVSKHKSMRQGHQPAQEIPVGSDSSDGSLAKRIYQGLEDDQDEDGNPSQQ